MSTPIKKPIIGILGGIGSGKSTVAQEFAKLGCKVIDADKIAHKLLEQPAVKDSIIKLFGDSILEPTGKVNRKKLGEIVFSGDNKLRSLNQIIHPHVLKEAEELIGQYNRQDQVRAIVLDMPLLVEVGWAKRCDKLVFVDCKPELRASRAKKIGIFDENQLKIRENLQISLDNKARLTDNTVDNNSDFAALAGQVADIFFCIMDK